MADASGSGGLGALTLGGIAGVAVVVGGVVLYQLGMFGTVAPEGAVVSEQTAGLAANSNGAFSGDGAESGQPLQNRAVQEAAGNQVEAVEAVEQPETGASGEASGQERQVQDQGETVTDLPETEAAVEESTIPEPDSAGNEENTSDQGTELAALAEPSVAAPKGQPEPETQTRKDDVFVLQAPELDLVRVDSEGAAVIAGRAQEGVRVSVLLDGEVLEQLEVPAGGEFVSLATIAPSSVARVVSLRAEHEGEQAASGATFILAPVSPVAAVSAETPEDAGEEQVAALEQDGPAEEPAAAGQEAEQAGGTDTAQGPESAAQADTTFDAANEAPATEEAMVGEGVGQGAAATAAAEPAEENQEAAAEPEASQTQGQTVAVLRADQDGVEVVQPAVPADPELSKEVALDAISYNGTGGVELSGRARPNARVRVYVDNQPVAEVDAAENGQWNGRLEDVAPGVYTLRLDEIEAATGKVVSRLETPFKREAPEVLPQPEREADPEQPVPLVRAVTVQKGDTLWAISQEKYGSGFLYVRVFEANRGAIRDPDLIYPGQVFTIPE
ncbi:LysM peptidoglycan-binding domain-containing protein [Leisingera sp. ANG59]|uniref:LysM peptidoglycan-binding domain-containing protein n=1 Tax=Leisingera sp. ANG59 TaxID=2675221 RepID=UPI00157214FC|nr:LysM peptidoglycan-binding domain-containing protein [Leisingera sp. ANG59]NSY36788.1 LysM peptidoglycan-binding domain-containing protein [Leisingera sp. ANG59]